ncbi:PepSY domain-containing protein [Methylopila henanensis]|uniref:PepSY domain-containing protein n=1 Tax=Methylopila henanensis TaxID=873516 RepID=A0ABW4K808_9HYPH
MISVRAIGFTSCVVAAALAFGPAAAEDDARPDGRPRIVVPAPGAGEYLRVPAPPPGEDGPPPGVYRRVTPPADGEPRGERYMQAAPTREPAPKAPDARDDGRRLPSGGGCLSARDARDAIRSKKAVALVVAARTARDAWDGEVIDYKLCSVEGLLTYDITLLSPDGKVARARIDAGTGKLLTVK